MSSALQVQPIPLGKYGLNGSKNMSQMPQEALLEAKNVTYENGVIEKEGGAKKFNTIPCRIKK